MQEVEKLKQVLEIPSEKENLMSRYNTLNNFKVDCCLDLDEVFNKKYINPEIAKAIALQTINRKYPQKDWLYIYTDGSLMDQNEGAGATCQYFSLYKNIGKYTTNFDGEVEAIYTSLQNVFVWLNQCKNIVILSDSKAAIQSISPTISPKMEKVKEIHCMVKQIQMLNKKVVFQWIPAHCGLNGNKKADMLAKKGTYINLKTNFKFSYESIKRVIKRISYSEQAKHQNSKWKESFKDPKLIPDLPRKSAMAMFRLITGHDCLSKHLHRIGVLNSPKCLLCTREEDMEMEHLANCETLRTFVDLPSKYWEARRMMTSLLNPEH
ncbi:uncharacterized protein [Periplaneta americana]|uniref:uncharacterized protein n=1 Tax=Periplaneta americana TaxID=6978 RepID=UPI0037E8EA4A